MQVFQLEELILSLERITPEIRFRDVVSSPTFKAGLIAFAPGGMADPSRSFTRTKMFSVTSSAGEAVCGLTAP